MDKPVDTQCSEKLSSGQSDIPAARVTKPFESACGHQSLEREKAFEALYKLEQGFDFEGGEVLLNTVDDYIHSLEAENRGLQYELDDAKADLRWSKMRF